MKNSMKFFLTLILLIPLTTKLQETTPQHNRQSDIQELISRPDEDGENLNEIAKTLLMIYKQYGENNDKCIDALKSGQDFEKQEELLDNRKIILIEAESAFKKLNTELNLVRKKNKVPEFVNLNFAHKESDLSELKHEKEHEDFITSDNYFEKEKFGAFCSTFCLWPVCKLENLMPSLKNYKWIQDNRELCGGMFIGATTIVVVLGVVAMCSYYKNKKTKK